MSRKLRVVFMGTPEFSVPALTALNQHFEIVGVYSQPDRPVGRGLVLTPPPVKKEALRLGIPVFQPEKLSLPGEADKVRGLNPDVIVVVAFGQLLRSDILNIPRLGCINIHGSLLPRWRGAAPIQRSILSGDQETGITTMRMVEKLDAGAMLLMERIPILPSDTASTMHDKLSAIGATLIVQTLQGLESNTLKDQLQDESLVTYAKKLTKEMEWQDPIQSTALEMDRAIRALNPWPGTSIFANSRIKIKEAKLIDAEHFQPGLLKISNRKLFLGTKQGTLQLIRLQWDGKKEILADDWISRLSPHDRKTFSIICTTPQVPPKGNS